VKLNRRKLHHYLRTARQLKTWQLVIIFILMCFVSATLLRINNLGMLDHREMVAKADESGDKQKIQEELLSLQRYVSAHMNTSLESGVYLEHSYNRDRDAAIQKASESTNPNSKIYQRASNECQSRFVGGVESFRNDYVQCVLDRVSALSAAEDAVGGLQLPKADLYRYDFASPVWTPDVAGLSTLLTLLLGIIIIFKLLFEIIARLLLKRRYKQIYS
jgi:hypothetical protein